LGFTACLPIATTRDAGFPHTFWPSSDRRRLAIDSFSMLPVKLFLGRFLLAGFYFGFAEVQMQPGLAHRHGSSGA
jgi:hypothetical protein